MSGGGDGSGNSYSYPTPGYVNSDATQQALTNAYSGNAPSYNPSKPYDDPYKSYPLTKWVACKCAPAYSGKYCELHTCDPLALCSADPLVLSIPRNVQVECGSDMSATVNGTGSALVADNCRGTTIVVSDQYSAGPQVCEASMRVRRTFVGRDRCGASTQGQQLVTVVDTKPPRVKVTLDPLPPIAVSASPIRLTPEQTKRLLKILLELSVFAKKGVLNIDMFKANDPLNDISPILKQLMGVDTSKMSMADAFGVDTATLLANNGFDLTSIQSLLASDPTLSGAGAAVTKQPAYPLSSPPGTSGVGLANLGSLFSGAGVGSSMSAMGSTVDSAMKYGMDKLRAVQVPGNDNVDDLLMNWMTSDIALPVGVQTCSLPSTRVFMVKCQAYDKCTKGEKLKAAARLKVTKIVNRNAISVDRVLNAIDPEQRMDMGMGMIDPMHNMQNMQKPMPMPAMHMEMPALMHMDMFDPKVMMRPDDMIKFKDMKDPKKFMKMEMPMDMVKMVDPVKMVKPYSTDSDPISDLSSVAGSFDAILADATQPYNTVTGTMVGGGNTGSPGVAPAGAMSSLMNVNGQWMRMDPSKMALMDPKKMKDPKNAKKKDPDTTVLAFQCQTAVEYVDVYCDQMVSITLEAEDACLADNFASVDHSFKGHHTFSRSDFGADFQRSSSSIPDYKFKNVTTVIGTDVVLEVLAEDGCYNVGRAIDDPARDCETFVSGRCCPPITNQVSQYFRDKVLSDAFPQSNGMMSLMNTNPANKVQLGFDDLAGLLAKLNKPVV